MKFPFPIRLGLALLAGLLAWATGPFGLLDKDVVSEVPAWILPGICFSALVLVHADAWAGAGRSTATLGTGVAAWVAAFGVAGFGWWIFGWLAFALAGLASGVVLGLLFPRIIRSRRSGAYLVALSLAGLLGGMPFALCFRGMDWKDFFAPQWVVPSFLVWNLAVATALHFCARPARAEGAAAASDDATSR